MRTGPFHYRIFGLRLLSELELPELVVDTDDDSGSDLHVARGPRLKAPAKPGLETLPDGGVRMSIPNAGDYVIKNGDRIEVRAEKKADERNVRLFLLGSAMGTLLHQRGLLPLHANAVEIDGSAVAFMGESGAGKSTLAAWFHERGHRILADDVCVVSFDGKGHCWAQPGIPRLRIWRQSLPAVGLTADGLERSYAGDDKYDKWDVPVAHHLRGLNPAPLSAIFILTRGDKFDLLRLEGVQAMQELFAHTYRGAMVNRAGTAEAHWNQCLRLLAEVPVFRLQRVWDIDKLREQNEALLTAVRAQGSTLTPTGFPPTE